MILFIGGATASGKSGLAVNVAKKLNGEIVSADSMQIYRDMNIGTAKISQNEMDGVAHHLLDVANPEDSFSVAQYADLAKNAIADIEDKRRLPIVCGGTGLYINALLYDYKMSAYDPKLREKLIKEAETEGIDALYERLKSLDKNADKIDPRNKKRVIRALEVILTEGRSILDKSDKENSIPHLLYAIDVPRDILYENINRRVDEMFENGLVEEVDYLHNVRGISFDSQSMQGIGYKEFASYYAGEITLNEVKSLIQQHTRNYAKRQLTWFKRIPSCIWLKYGQDEQNIDIICNDYYKYLSNVE